MTYDINDDACCEALRLLILISKHENYLESDEDYSIIARNLRSPNRRISSLASDLILSINSVKIVKSPTDDQKLEFLKIIASCIIEHSDLQNTLLVIDSFNNVSHYFTSWDIYAGFLSNSECIKSKNLPFLKTYLASDAGQDFLFLSIMNAAINYYILMNFPIGRNIRKNMQQDLAKKSQETGASFTGLIMDVYIKLFENWNIMSLEKLGDT